MSRQPFIRPNYPIVTPRIVANDTEALVTFLRKVFDATGEYRSDIPSEIKIGDSMLLISEPGVRPPTPAFLYVYVRDADVTYQRALEAGARSLEKPTDMPYGDRRCMVEDAWGNVWQIATFQR
jgi:PhnB protein